MMRAAANSCVYVRTRTVPARFSAASNTASALGAAPGPRCVPARRRERPDFSTTTGLVRAAARSADRKRRAIAQRLDVEQDAVGAGIEQQRVEQLAEVDVERVAQRDHRREADAGGRREIEHRRAHGARLRDQREPAGQRLHGAERRVEAESVRITPNASGPTKRMPCFAATTAISRAQRRAAVVPTAAPSGSPPSCNPTLPPCASTSAT